MLAFLLTLQSPTFAHEPVVRGPPPPLPPAVPIGLSIPILLLIALSIAWWLVRRFATPGTKRWARIGVFGAAIGNALVELGSFLQPDRPQVVEIQRLREARPADDVGDGRDAAPPP